ncbi:protein LNK2-like isoform X1 [Chenopodium quinoa]|uniref:protein LNK2-like isoform X1 n=1 Tax=Chenopodium quinoa TaxID=63459 RepID=UPI000B77FE71|nr:protein LNK2-like isoform X1 [Chenopodium quinoa]
MFDWDDQELANIIWGEGREADDHIVPYPEDIEKKVLSDSGDNDQKTLTEKNSKSEAVEKNASTSKLFIDGCKRDKNDGLSASGEVVDSQLDLPSFSASKSDDSGIVGAKKIQLGGVSQSSQIHHEDKELGDLVGNSWASIGSFDDLDRIFSNDDLDGSTSLGSTDELWSSPKDLLSGAAKSSSAALRSTHWEFGALGSAATNIEINPEYLHNEDSSVTTGCRKAGSISPCPRRTIDRHLEHKDYAVDTTGLVEEKIGLGITLKTPIDSHTAAENIASPNNPTVKEKWSETQSKYELATDRLTDSRLLQDVYDNWPSSATNAPQFSRQCAPSTVENHSVSVPVQHQLSQEFRPFSYQNFSTPYGAPYACGNFTSNPALRMLKHTEDENQSILSSSEVSPGDVINKPVGSLGTSTKHTKMTPQEKIEKLRRRQQMRAMLAIQKQQQRLGHQASSGDYSRSRKSCLEDPVRHMENSDLEVDDILSIVPCYDPGSPNKGDDSSMISNIDDYSAEDTVLYQLQDIVSRLDMKIRLCIRDSLYRLAHSATRRLYVSYTSSKKSSTFEPDIAKEETSNHDRFVGNANVETETNHIDRAVAHLLFHRPLKLSSRYAETPESSTSTKVSTEPEPPAPSSKPIGLLPKNSENEYILYPRGSKSLHDFVDSNEGDVSNDVSLNEMSINPPIEQTTAEHAD